MKTTLPALALLALAACGYQSELEDPKPEYPPITIENEPGRLDIEPPPGPGIQYIAWSIAEDKALTGWVDSLDEARRVGAEYHDKYPDWGWTLLWRAKPDSKPLTPR
jgi:hypothetical protein